VLRKSSRRQGKINYADLVNGVVSHQSKWRVLLESTHFLSDKFERIERAEDLTLDRLRKSGFKAPIIVPARPPSQPFGGAHVVGESGNDAHHSRGSMNGLDMRMPPSSLSVDDVRDAVGPETLVEVMDVATQSELLGWNLRDWADYFKTEPKERVYNVISLEITGTPLAKQIQRPRIVR
jgi:F-box/leucine-rich repeat protein 10/11